MAQASDLQAKLLPSYLATVKTIKGTVRPLLISLLLLTLTLFVFSPLSLSSPLLPLPLSPSYSLAFLFSLSFPPSFLLAMAGLSLSTFSLSPCLSIIKL